MDCKTDMKEEYTPPNSWPRLITQPELNDLIRDLNLFEIKAEVFASRVQEWNLVETNVKTPV